MAEGGSSGADTHMSVECTDQTECQGQDHPIHRHHEMASSLKSVDTSYSAFKEEKQGSEIVVKVGRVFTENPEPMTFRGDDTITDMVQKIKSEHLLANKDVLVYERVETEGNIREPLGFDDPLAPYQNKELVFHIKSEKPSYDDIKPHICQQNIACLGAPGHGKSSFTNTLMKSFGKEPCAATFREAHSGTTVYTPYRVDVEEAAFTLWDVPGQGIKSIPEGQLQKTLTNILSGKEQPNAKIGAGTRWTSEECRKIHAILAIQDGRAETDQMHSDFLAVATKSGRGIPMFIIMTHIDQMKTEDIEEAEENISKRVGIDRNKIFRIANYDSSGESMIRSKEDPQREFYVRGIMKKILAASKSYIDNNTDASGSCSIL